jgi:hypothetical protein
MAYKLEVIVQGGSLSEAGIIHMIDHCMNDYDWVYTEKPRVKVISIEKVRDRKSLNAKNTNQTNR